MGEDKQPEQSESSNLTAENSVFHSGKLPEEMAERPVMEFDNTPLEQAHERNLISPLPEHPGELLGHTNDSLQSPSTQDAAETEDLVTNKSTRNKLAVLIGGGAFTLAAIGIGYSFGKDSPEDTPTERVIVSDETAEDQPTSTTFESNDADPSNTVPEFDSSIEGSIDISRVIDGDETIKMEWNNQTIEIPRLRDTDDTKLFLESFFALEACFISTGNEECLNELSTDKAFHEDLIAIRNVHLGKSSNAHLDDNGAPDSWQIAIYDNPENPAVFSDSTDEFGNRQITLTSGTLYQNYWHSPEWQGEDTKQMVDALSYNFVTNEFRITVSKNPDTNDIKIIGINWVAN